MKYLNKLFNNISEEDWQSWEWQLKHSFRSIKELHALGLHESLTDVEDKYPFCLSPYYLSLIDELNYGDPIYKMSIPSIYEIAPAIYNEPDPFEEQKHSPIPGIINRYKNRVVLLATNLCAVNCRHCTRKNTLKNIETHDYFDAIFEYLVEHTEIREVLVSGGDPLMLSDEKLDWLLGNIKKNEHIKVIRIGTRIPTTLPMRVTHELAKTLAKHSPVWISTHFNSPKELTEEAKTACARLVDAGLPIVNQTVLLKDVNDDINILKNLFNGLQETRIKPYYAFLGDPVQGTEQFYVSIEDALMLENKLRKEISGLCMPAFVADVADQGSKIPIRDLMTVATEQPNNQE
jgi:lysine 2,3-aminomutase